MFDDTQNRNKTGSKTFFDAKFLDTESITFFYTQPNNIQKLEKVLKLKSFKIGMAHSGGKQVCILFPTVKKRNTKYKMLYMEAARMCA